MTRIRILLDQEISQSLIKAYIKDSHCWFFLPVALEIYKTLVCGGTDVYV